MQRTFDELRRARAADPATSKAAARGAPRVAHAHAVAILAVLRSAGGALTGHEIASRCGLSAVQVLRRTAQLRDDGEIVADASDGLSPSGRPAQRWRVS